MRTTPPDPWKPDPERLAAFCDGEVHDAAERARIEAYLAEHPEAQAEMASLRQLRGLWEKTTPPQPTPATWKDQEARLDEPPRPRPELPRLQPLMRTVLIVAVAACLALAWVLTTLTRPVPAPAAVPVLPVASADEIEILHIDGEDIASIVVGTLPLVGVLELADSGDVEVHSVQPMHRTQRMPMVPAEGRRPMIWARLDTEENE